MPLNTFKAALRRCARSKRVVALIAGLWALVALAASAAETQDQDGVPVADAAATSQDSQSQQIKYQALDLQAQAQGLLGRSEIPDVSQLTIYIATASSIERPRHFGVSIDGGATTQTDIDDSAAAALAESEGLLRIVRFKVADGAHELHVEMDYSAPSPGVASDMQLSLDQHFEKKPGAVDLVFSGRAKSAFSSAHIQTQILQARGLKSGSLLRVISEIKSPVGEASFVRGSRDDPEMRYAAYLSQSGAHDTALVELMVLGYELADDRLLSENYRLRLAAASRMAGLLDRAQSICDRLSANGGSPPAIAIERLHLGQAQFESGNLTGAAALLAIARNGLPEDRLQDWRFADAQVLFALQRPAEAVNILAQSNNDSIEAIRYLTDPILSLRSAAYGRFNLGIALLQNDQPDKGLSWLDLIGRLNSKDQYLIALRDRANLTLGWHFLKAKQGRTALGVFGRVQSAGLAADEALLGIGWSQLVPAGPRVARTRLPDQSNEHSDPFNELPAAIKNSLTQLHVLEPELRGGAEPRSFARDDPSADRNEGLRRAIKLWMVLAERDPQEQSVDEGLLAIAYAYDQLDDRAQAREAYQKAIAALTAIRDGLVENQTAVKRGALSDAIAHVGSADERFLAMYRFGITPEESEDTLFATLDRYENFESLLTGLRQSKSRLADGQTADSAVSTDETNPAGGGARAADAPGSSLITQIGALERSIQLQQGMDAERIKTLAAARLTKREIVIERYLDAAYLSAARIEDRSFKAEPSN